MSLENLVAILSAVSLLVVGLMLRRIERRLDHIEDLRISDARQEVAAGAMLERLKGVETESRKWDTVIQSLTELSKQLASMLDRMQARG